MTSTYYLVVLIHISQVGMTESGRLITSANNARRYDNMVLTVYNELALEKIEVAA